MADALNSLIESLGPPKSSPAGDPLDDLMREVSGQRANSRAPVPRPSVIQKAEPLPPELQRPLYAPSSSGIAFRQTGEPEPPEPLEVPPFKPIPLAPPRLSAPSQAAPPIPKPQPEAPGEIPAPEPLEPLPAEKPASITAQPGIPKVQRNRVQQPKPAPAGSVQILEEEPPRPPARGLINTRMILPEQAVIPQPRESYEEIVTEAIHAAKRGNLKPALRAAFTSPVNLDAIDKELKSFLVGPFAIHRGVIEGTIAAGTAPATTLTGAAISGTARLASAARSPAIRAAWEAADTAISTYFAGAMGTAAYKAGERGIEALKQGDYDTAAEALGFGTVDGLFAYIGAKNALQKGMAIQSGIREGIRIGKTQRALQSELNRREQVRRQTERMRRQQPGLPAPQEPANPEAQAAPVAPAEPPPPPDISLEPEAPQALSSAISQRPNPRATIDPDLGPVASQPRETRTAPVASTEAQPPAPPRSEVIQTGKGASPAAEAPPPALSSRTQVVAPEGPSESTQNRTSAQPTVPEAPETLKLQVLQLATGQRRAVMFPKGTPLQKRPKGVKAFTDEDGNAFFYAPNLTSPQEIEKATQENRLTELLGAAEGGMGAPDKSRLQGEPMAVVGKTPEGQTVQATATDQEHLPKTIEQAEKITPGQGSVSVERPEQEIERRKQPGTFDTRADSHEGSASPNGVPLDAGRSEKAEPVAVEPVEKPIDMEIKFPLSHDAQNGLASVAGDPHVARIARNAGITRIRVDEPYTFELSQEGAVTASGVMRLNPNAQNLKNTFLHELGETIWNRASDSQRSRLEALARLNEDMLARYAPGYWRMLLEGKPHEAVAEMFGLLDSLGPNTKEELAGIVPVKAFADVFKQAAPEPLPARQAASGVRSWEDIQRNGGYLTQDDDLAAIANEHGERTVVIKDVNGGRHRLPASKAAKALQDPLVDGHVGSVYALPGKEIETHVDDYTLNYLPNMAKGFARSLPELAEKSPAIKRQLPAKARVREIESLEPADVSGGQLPAPEPLESTSRPARLAKKRTVPRPSSEPQAPEPLESTSRPMSSGSELKSAEGRSEATKEEPKHDYSSTQVNLQGPVADKILSLSRQIPDNDLADDGREIEPHITVKYGLHGEDPEQVRKLIENEPPVKVRFGKTSIFPNSESDSGDVVKVDVDSEDLHRLNKKIADALPHTDTHPGYKPHATIAYVKPGLGKKYAGNDALEGQEAVIDRIVFSSKNGEKTEIPLQGIPAPEPVEKAESPKSEVEAPLHAQTAEVRIEKAKGYTGKRSARSYIAKITGTNPKYRFNREFREPDEIHWGSSKLYRKNKGVWNEVHNLDPGLYERQTFGDRDYLIVWLKNGKTAGWGTIPVERASQIAKLMDEGADFEKARKATKPAKPARQGETSQIQPVPQAEQAEPANAEHNEKPATAHPSSFIHEESGSSNVVAALGVDKFVAEDLVPALHTAGSRAKTIVRGLVLGLAPRTSSESWIGKLIDSGLTQNTLDKVYGMKGDREKAGFILRAASEHFAKLTGKLSRNEQIDFWDRGRSGEEQKTPELEAVAEFIRGVDDQLLQEIQKYSDVKELENHFGTILWKTPPSETAENGFEGGKDRPLEGSKGYLKKRVFQTISEGLQAGGIPTTYDPMEMLYRHYADAMKFITAERMIEWGKKSRPETIRFVRFVKGKSAPKPEGFDWVEDRAFRSYFKTDKSIVEPGRWAVETGFARLLNNYLGRDYLRDESGLLGAAGKSLLAVKNASTAVELGLSLFHGMFETLETAGSGIGLGIRQLLNRGIRGDVPALWQGFRNIAAGLGIAPAAGETWAAGKAAEQLERAIAKESTLPGSLAEFKSSAMGKYLLKQFPQAEELVNDYFGGGGIMGMSRDYRLNTLRALEDAIHEGNYLGAAFRAAPGALEATMTPLFEWYIPRLKLGMFLRDMSEDLVERRADLANGRITRAQLARQNVDFVEDRLGEMNFDNLFWNRTLKSALQLLFRSVTWKMGNIRGGWKAIKGQIAEAAGAVAEGRPPRVTREFSWLLGMSMLTAVYGSVLMYLATGKRPREIKDLVYPQVDPKDPSARVGMATYLRDYYHLAHTLTGYVTSSFSGILGQLADIWRNKQFNGEKVYEEDDSVWRRQWDKLKHLFPTPFSIESIKRTRDTGGGPAKQAAGFIGVPKAPRYISQTPAEALASEYARRHGSAEGRTHAAQRRLEARGKIISALRSGNSAKPEIDAALKAGQIVTAEIPRLRAESRIFPLLRQLRPLTPGEALKVFEQAGPEERAKISAAVRAKLVHARTKPWEWSPETIQQSQKLFGIKPYNAPHRIPSPEPLEKRRSGLMMGPSPAVMAKSGFSGLESPEPLG